MFLSGAPVTDSWVGRCLWLQAALHARKAAPLTLALLAQALCARLGIPTLPLRAAPVAMVSAGAAALQVERTAAPDSSAILDLYLAASWM